MRQIGVVGAPTSGESTLESLLGPRAVRFGPLEAPAWADLKPWPRSRHVLASWVDEPPSRCRFGAEVNLEWTAHVHKPSC